METRQYWEENGHSVKYENYNSDDGLGRGMAEQLNFAAPSDEEGDYPQGNYLKKGKVSRQQDPMSHRIIEKRRRDRMNNCLADLSRLIPPEYLKKGRGRVEKTEIIEMAIRHLKYLQDRANVAEKHIGEDFRAGYQEAVSEAIRFLVEVQGYNPVDGLCAQLASHLQRHCEHIVKGEMVPREKRSHQTSSSETTSSSGSTHGYNMVKHHPNGVIAHCRTEPHPEPRTYAAELYEHSVPDQSYPLDCDRVSVTQISILAHKEATPEGEPLPLDGRRKRETTLRTVRKPEHNDDYLHSYKFKNNIEMRFSRSQDCEATDMSVRVENGHNKAYCHKRRRATKPVPPSTSTSGSGSGSTEDARDTSPQDTSSESPHHHYDQPPQTQYVPIFALNSLGKYYVPLNVEYSCLARLLAPMAAPHAGTPLHPVTIHVNFQPCLGFHAKR